MVLEQQANKQQLHFNYHAAAEDIFHLRKKMPFLNYRVLEKHLRNIAELYPAKSNSRKRVAVDDLESAPSRCRYDSVPALAYPMR